jgi:hypothetical protein
MGLHQRRQEQAAAARVSARGRPGRSRKRRTRREICAPSGGSGCWRIEEQRGGHEQRGGAPNCARNEVTWVTILPTPARRGQCRLTERARPNTSNAWVGGGSRCRAASCRAGPPVAEYTRYGIRSGSKRWCDRRTRTCAAGSHLNDCRQRRLPGRRHCSAASTSWRISATRGARVPMVPSRSTGSSVAPRFHRSSWATRTAPLRQQPQTVDRSPILCGRRPPPCRPVVARAAARRCADARCSAAAVGTAPTTIAPPRHALVQHADRTVPE